MLGGVPAVYYTAGGVILVVVVLIIVVVRNQNTECSADFLLQSRSSLDGEPWWERAAAARRMSIDVNTCRVCQKPTTTRCSQCKSVQYCGQVCQRKDWGSCHKFECQNLKNLKQKAAKAAAAGISKPPFLDPNEDAPVPQQVLFSYDLFLQLRKNANTCRRPPVGLTNHGNNCYANAALQCLLFTKPLRAYLDQGLHCSNCNRPHDRDWCLLCVLTRLCRDMTDVHLNSEISLKPLLRHLRRFAKTMSYGRQEDAHEFFYSVLNTMEAIQLTNFGGKDRFDMRSQETTLVHHVFGGYLRSQVVCCGCGAASRRYEAALDLQLEVPHGVDRLEDVLHRHTADEVLDGDNCYACDGCKQRCRATRSTRFEVAPNTLVLCLKRFGTGRFGKINKVLVYGEKLDLGPFMARGAMDEGPATYTLTGVVVHLDQMNSTSFGHYISFVRTLDGNGSSSHGQWYACDDSRVCRTRAADVLSQNAYMLFYQRDTPKPAPNAEYRRPRPLLPLTAAQQAALAAAAAAPTTPKAHEAAVKANGVAAAEADMQHAMPDTSQLDQRHQQVLAEAAAGLLELQGEQQQQPEQAAQQQQQQMPLAAMRSQPAPDQADAAELLPRIATAPAALALLAGREGSSSSRDDDECASHVTTSSSSCMADVSECSTPSSQVHGGIGGAWPANHNRSSSSGSAGSRLASQATEQPAAAAAPGAGQLPQHTLLRQRRRQKQQQQRQQDAAGAEAPGQEQQDGAAAAATGNGLAACSRSSSTSSELPSIKCRLLRSGPELLQLRAVLPGVVSGGDVQVAVEASGEASDQQCLWLQVPGRFAELQLPLSSYLQPGQVVSGVAGHWSQRKQELKLKLQLTGGESAGAGGTCEQQGVGPVLYHLTDSFDTSSGSESEGYQPARRGMHAVASERDLCSIFGRHSSTVAHQLMQQLQQWQPGADGQQGEPQANGGRPSSARKSAGRSSSAKKAAGKKKKKKRK